MTRLRSAKIGSISALEPAQLLGAARRGRGRHHAALIPGHPGRLHINEPSGTGLLLTVVE
jgi:hypothetical protein